MQKPSFISLLTDFGTSDWFVGTMKGVIGQIAPETRVTDLTHEIPAGDIRAGAFSLRAAYHFLPKGTVHLGVVDPGVGSKRKAVAVQTADYMFVGPDNGLLSWALRAENIKAIHSLQNEAYFLSPVSRTFHGRDIFAPVVAHLSRGVPISKFGPPQTDLVCLPWPELRRTDGRLVGEIIYLDRFGNAITNIDTASLHALGKRKIGVMAKGKRLCSLRDHYGAVPAGKPVAVIDSSGFLEIAINGGNAAKQLRLRVGDSVKLEGK